MALWVMRLVLSAVFAAAALTQMFGAGHWVGVFQSLGMDPWGRWLTALAELAALVLFWWPGRMAYGAAGLLAVSVAAFVAHLTVLGISSAPPAVVLAVLSGLILRRHRADFQR